jgi:hypothetical protein
VIGGFVPISGVHVVIIAAAEDRAQPAPLGRSWIIGGQLEPGSQGLSDAIEASIDRAACRLSARLEARYPRPRANPVVSRR